MRETEADKRELSIQTLSTRNKIEIIISDTGPGAAIEAIDQLFYPFFTTKSDGMGLGFSISRSIIEAHQGRLWATPKLSSGINFHFSLPTF